MLLVIHKPRPALAERASASLDATLRAAGIVLTVVDAVVMGPFRALERRQVLHTMTAMSDHDLRDIGLMRGDIRDATAMPAGRDTSLFLAERRAVRRQNSFPHRTTRLGSKLLNRV